MKIVDSVKNDLRTDVTWRKAGRLASNGARALPSASKQYLLDKVPIVGWLPRYNPRWILNDVIAGLTVGLMLIPQGLSYATLATIPVQYGLMSSWLPGAVYAFMGTTKDLSTGPTSLIGLLTEGIIDELGVDSPYTPSQFASAIALMMGIYGMILGFLKLGFLLEFVSIPIITGFISAVAITIILNQMGSLLGTDVSSSAKAYTQIRQVFEFLPQASGLTCAIGFTTILFLTVLDQAGKRWGHKYKALWLLSITRAFLALVIFTSISYAVNHNLSSDDYLFNVVKVQSNGQEAPSVPSFDLVGKVAVRSLTVFIGAAIEHTAIARAFGVKNNYSPDQSQELCYFGVINFFNSFFHAMGVGGAMSRTSVNSSCKVKSPLSGLVTTAVILICIYELVGTLYWIPKATLAGIIICAVWPLIYPPSTFYRFWKTSLADFITSMLAFWLSLFYSTEFGIFIPIGFNIIYNILRQTFTSVSSSAPARSELASSLDAARGLPPSDIADHMLQDVHVFRFNESFFFPNSHRLTGRIVDSVQTHHSPIYNGSFGSEKERNWSVVAQKRVERLRQAAGVTDPGALPPIGMVVLDFGRVNHIDTTAVQHLTTLVSEIRRYGGKDVEFRFVDLTDYVRARFERAGWPILDAREFPADYGDEEATRVYGSVAEAVMAPRRYIEADEMSEKGGTVREV